MNKQQLLKKLSGIEWDDFEVKYPRHEWRGYFTEPRNPVIAKVFRLLGWADRSGSGIEKITKGWMGMGYDKPIFQDDQPVNMFEVIFPLVKESEKKVGEEVTERVTEKVTDNQCKILDSVDEKAVCWEFRRTGTEYAF